MAKVIPYDPEVVLKKVRETIQAKFAELIPEEQWDIMIKKAMDDFVEQHANTLVRTQTSELLKEKIKERFDKLSISSDWNNTIDEKLSEIIKKNAGDLMSGMIGSAMAGILQEMRNRLGQY